MDLSFFYNIPVFVPETVCISCDGCCRFRKDSLFWIPYISKDEVDAWEYDKESLIKRESSVFCIKTVSDDNSDIVRCCFFCKDVNKCRIYHHRPFECRLYPFLLCRQKDSIMLGVHLACPYVQDNLGTESFDRYVSSLMQYLSRPDVMEFIYRNKLLAGDYSAAKDEIMLFSFPLCKDDR